MAGQGRAIRRGPGQARRKQLWEARETGGKTSLTSLKDGRKRGRQHTEGFASETAAITGQSKRTINQKIARAEKIEPAVLEEVKGTDLDKGVVLDQLARTQAGTASRYISSVITTGFRLPVF
jgi:hypothetical protein